MTRRGRQGDDDELALLRYAAIVVFIVLSAVVVGADILGRQGLGGRGGDPVIMGLVFGTLLSLLGLEGVQRLLNRGDK